MKNIIYCFILTSLLACQTKKARTLSLEHQKALASMQVMDGFEIEMVAAEPLVADPVAMEIDEDGNMYVVEMHGYPLDLSNTGKIKLLKDTDDDGYPDKATIFADSLRLPNGIQRWKNGFIVTDTPDVLYLEDSNGDGVADIRKKILTGFALSNPQHNLNTPRFESDNWIYLGHEGVVTPFVYTKEFGDNGRVITFPDKPNSPKLGINANGRMVRFKPDTYELEELSGETQYGHTQDAWGHRIYTSNANHLFHEVLDKKYIDNNPNLLVSNATQNIPDHGDACEVFPITENPNHQLLTDVGVITSSCGVTWYLGGAFGDKFKNVSFIAEPVHNLVHADIIEENRATFTAKRLLEKKEFLASKDAWFRPVNFYIGPDGALYVIDYYRQLIEHPEWMSDEVNKSGALYNGKDKGRIYRITPKGGLSMDWLGKLNLSKKSDTELAQLLDNQNIWYRRTIQRLLLHRNAKGVVPALKTLVERGQNPEAKINALWLLNHFKGLDNQLIEVALKDKEAGVRECAIKLGQSSNALLTLQNDPSPKVRFQLLNALGQIKTLEAEKARLAILKQDFADKWVGIAAVAASKGSEVELLKFASKEEKMLKSLDFFAYLGATIANSKDKKAFEEMINTPSEGKAAILSGITQLWSYKGITVPIDDSFKSNLLTNLSSNSSELRKSSLELLAITGLPNGNLLNETLKNASKIALDPKQKEDLRADMISLLALSNLIAYQGMIQRILVNKEPEIIQEAAIKTLSKTADNQTCAFILKQWNLFSPKVKNDAVNLFLADPKRIHLLLNAIDEKIVNRNEVGWGRTVEMMNYYDTDVRSHARKVLSLNEDRKAVLQQYMVVVEQKGNKIEGEKVFEQNCKICHQMGNSGTDFGPNLTTLRSRNTFSILTEIINPNNSIADKYDLWKISFKNGNIINGIIVTENANTLTIKEMGGKQTTIQRIDIAKLEKSGTSPMPNGLENAISKKQMADLIAYIKNQ
ncbi:PVC-type heme-binding CxxCH protein [Emticicia sp. SJ17W-69]|uniref:PVC-type heme-binding CxxCH protein n=1 Tax=Emticicia sp. SJ17W-69 TaxID=3421657 RepID=UPI003EBEF2AF